MTLAITKDWKASKSFSLLGNAKDYCMLSLLTFLLINSINATPLPERPPNKQGRPPTQPRERPPPPQGPPEGRSPPPEKITNPESTTLGLPNAVTPTISVQSALPSVIGMSTKTISQPTSSKDPPLLAPTQTQKASQPSTISSLTENIPKGSKNSEFNGENLTPKSTSSDKNSSQHQNSSSSTIWIYPTIGAVLVLIIFSAGKLKSRKDTSNVDGLKSYSYDNPRGSADQSAILNSENNCASSNSSLSKFFPSESLAKCYNSLNSSIFYASTFSSDNINPMELRNGSKNNSKVYNK